MPPPSLFLNLSHALCWDSGSTAFSRREDHRLQILSYGLDLLIPDAGISLAGVRGGSERQ